ncbi:hypothetical protein [Butyrivibrio sp. INlla16]|uniref:hypothetical protein n=1 Tax=Butyrivibrio sp. INlla16 TaxID=1520807 RepID=UPI00088F38D2|nr:hypothetical protein [Butyrivibrio sp. INlla16]SDB62288.1 hypothetical protein SAMN02910263_03359 [Butyrivibrio sp. INlla16]
MIEVKTSGPEWELKWFNRFLERAMQADVVVEPHIYQNKRDNLKHCNQKIKKHPFVKGKGKSDSKH